MWSRNRAALAAITSAMHTGPTLAACWPPLARPAPARPALASPAEVAACVNPPDPSQPLAPAPALLACTAAVSAALPAAELRAPAAAKLSHSFHALLRRNLRGQGRGAGATLVVLRHGRVLGSASAGFADISAKRAILPSTVFDLASVSKQFTAVAVLRLVERGVVKLDQPARAWIPELAEGKPRPLLVRDLLNMTSGLPDYTEAFEEEELPHVDNPAVARWAASVPRRAVGAAHRYSNTDYALLALIVERASGRTFADFLADEVLRPLAMNDSRAEARPGPSVDPARARGYRPRGASWVESRLDAPTVGDGNVYSSARDLGVWLSRLAAGEVLSPRLLGEAWRTGVDDRGRAHGYGFGWAVDGQTVSHSGSWNGTSTYVGYHRADGFAVVVLSNDESFDAESLGETAVRMARKAR